MGNLYFSKYYLCFCYCCCFNFNFRVSLLAFLQRHKPRKIIFLSSSSILIVAGLFKLFQLLLLHMCHETSIIFLFSPMNAQYSAVLILQTNLNERKKGQGSNYFISSQHRPIRYHTRCWVQPPLD